METIATVFGVGGGLLAAPPPRGYGLLTAGRAELKYCVPGPVSESVLALARRHLTPDPLALGPCQRVTSLYLDSAHLTFLRWHRERAVDRFKLRIRRYGEQPAAILYAEVKRKTGSVVRKRRAAFPAQALPAVLQGPGLAEGDGSRHDSADLREFVRRRSQSGATPRVLVTCLRESLRDPADGTAVTVDRALRYQLTCRGDLIGAAGAWRAMPLPGSAGGGALVEVKYAVHPPAWMDALMVQLAPWRVSFSKYAAAMHEAVS
ncbi:MAG: polyphosphate polymerase domain-containing protein [Acidobacteria bacterium]|nr:polyphosphate polymerase domain-containing protein [Acidobacteriota bacterium]